MWGDLCTQGSLREEDTPLHRECKRILSLTAVGGAKVEVMTTTITKLVVKMAYTLLAAARRVVTGTLIEITALEEATTLADFRPLSDSALILEHYMILSRAVVEELLEQLPQPYKTSQEVVAALQVKLSTLILRVGHLVEQEARVQGASYTNAVAELVVGEMTLQTCSIPLQRYHPMVTLDTAVLLEMEAKVSFLFM